MIKENFKIEKKEGGEYKPLPDGIYQVEFFDINVQEGETYNSKNGKTQQKEYEKTFNIQYVLLNGTDNGDSLRGRLLFHNFVHSYISVSSVAKGALYPIIKSFLGRDLAEEELATFTAEKMNKLIGKQARVGVKQITKNDKTYSNITEYYTVEGEELALSNEEKEKAIVKKKDDQQTIEEASDTSVQPAPVEDIPVIDADDESLPI